MDEWISTDNIIPEIGRRVQRFDRPDTEYLITHVNNRPIWHYSDHEWPHGHWADGNKTQWRYLTDVELYLDERSWQAAVKERPLKECLDFSLIGHTNGLVNKPGDIPFPHSWVEISIQLSTSNAEEIDKSQAIVLENTDSLTKNLQTTGEINICARPCSCDPCNNTASANLENRKELLKEKARDLIEFDPAILRDLLREIVGSNNSAQLIPWLKQLGES